jgi:hypothetical protein
MMGFSIGYLIGFCVVSAIVTAAALWWPKPKPKTVKPKPECDHNVWGVTQDNKVVCLDCGKKV